MSWRIARFLVDCPNQPLAANARQDFYRWIAEDPARQHEIQFLALGDPAQPYIWAMALEWFE
jgi:hypothetical protein